MSASLQRATALALRLAARNLWRNTRRTVITGLTIVLGVLFMLFLIAFSEGSYRSTVDTAARSGTGHVIIRPPGYDLLEPEPLPDGQAALRAAESIPGAVAAPRVQALVLAVGAAGAANIMALGIDPATERRFSIIPDSLIAGEWLPDETGRIPLALVGRPVAKKLDIEVGDRLVLTTQRGREIESLLTRVGGVFATNSDEVDANLVLVPISVTRELLGQPGAIHQVAVVLDHPGRAGRVRAQLAEALPGAEVLTWSEAVPALGDFIAMDRAGGNLLFTVLFAVVALVVLNAVLMSVFERVKEFGILLAVGVRPRLLFAVVVLEGLLLSLVSVAVGAALSGAAVTWLSRTGIDVSAVTGTQSMDMSGYSLSGVIYPTLPLQRTASAVVMVIVLTVLGSLYPAWKAARIAPVEAIHDV